MESKVDELKIPRRIGNFSDWGRGGGGRDGAPHFYVYVFLILLPLLVPYLFFVVTFYVSHYFLFITS